MMEGPVLEVRSYNIIKFNEVQCQFSDPMVIGFILISTRSREEENVMARLRSTPEVQEAHLLFGEYDIIAKVVARDFNGVSKIVLEKIRSIDGVVHTETLAGITF